MHATLLALLSVKNAGFIVMLLAGPCPHLPFLSCEHHKLSLATPAVMRLSMH